jgi:hypothetical protein
MSIDVLLDRLDAVRKSGKGYIAKCCSHQDKNPSLSLMVLSDGRILIHCHAGCSTYDVLSAIGLEMGDLFPDGGLGHYKGFQQIEEKIKTKQKDKYFSDEIILEIAKSDRAAGKRLSEKDRETERQAFMRIRARHQNAITRR